MNERLFKPGEFVKSKDLKLAHVKGRIIAIEGDFYKVFWLDPSLNSKFQMKFYECSVMEHFYERVMS